MLKSFKNENKQNHDMRRVSVLPVMVHPGTQLPYVLLGRGRRVESWVEGSMLWSDFGGISRGGEPEELTAARELMEETLGILIKPEDRDIFAQSLLDESYILRLQDSMSIMYLVRFEWNPSIPFLFDALYRKLLAISHICRGIPLSQQERLLMARVAWLKGAEAVFHHPSIEKRHHTLPRSVLQNAQDALCAEIRTSAVTVSPGKPVRTLIVDGVSSAWMEKDRIDLFSLNQLRCAYMSCPAGKSIELHASFAAVLSKAIQALVLRCGFNTSRRAE